MVTPRSCNSTYNVCHGVCGCVQTGGTHVSCSCTRPCMRRSGRTWRCICTDYTQPYIVLFFVLSFSQNVCVCSFVRTGGGYAPLQYDTAPSHALTESEGSQSHAPHTDSASHHRYRHRVSNTVKPGMTPSLIFNFCQLALIATTASRTETAPQGCYASCSMRTAQAHMCSVTCSLHVYTVLRLLVHSSWSPASRVKKGSPQVINLVYQLSSGLASHQHCITNASLSTCPLLSTMPTVPHS